jgi:hypothetical protein
VLALAGSLAGTLACCVLAGCGGDGKPTSDPAPSPASPSSSPTLTGAPTMPAAATAHTKAGAIAFVEFYIAAFNHAQATGDTSLLRRLATSDCKSCNDVAAAADMVYDAGGHISGGRWTISGTEVHRSVGMRWAVDVAGRLAPSDIYQSPSASPQHAPGGRTLTNFFVRYDRAWKVVEWSRAE